MGCFGVFFLPPWSFFEYSDVSWKLCQQQNGKNPQYFILVKPSDPCVHLLSCVGINSPLRSSGGTRPRPAARVSALVQTAPISLPRQSTGHQLNGSRPFSLPSGRRWIQMRLRAARCAPLNAPEEFLKKLHLTDESRETFGLLSALRSRSSVSYSYLDATVCIW